MLRELTGAPRAAPGRLLADGDERPTPAVPWLLGFALACALAELALRLRHREPEAT